MICREFPLLYSAQLDGHAEEREQMALQRHLRECPACRRQAAEMRSLGADLRTLPVPQPPLMAGRAKMDLTSQIQAALRVEARAYERVKRTRADLIDVWRTRLFSQGIGAVVSVAMLVMMLAGVMQPAYRTLALAQTVKSLILGDEPVLEESAANNIRFRVLIFQPPPPPVFAPTGDLLKLGESLSEDDEIIATLKVGRDGRASINEITGTPLDQTVRNKFSSAMTQQASFQRTPRAQATSAEAVVILSKVNIRASISS
ncbi:MAG: zf-HC2 domain-containing protein [Acidobacteriota bacterium]|nr:zf-HC2 domain-containing protein [Acidobacteriota bacterium]